jgi:hypothetical protein
MVKIAARHRGCEAEISVKGLTRSGMDISVSLKDEIMISLKRQDQTNRFGLHFH